jgi:hypothetical protein
MNDVVAGTGIASTCKRLSKCGRDAVLNALEGKCGPIPKNRHPRDINDDLIGAPFALASVNPGLLIAALDRRPQHAMSLIWALGGSRNDAPVEKLIEYSRDKDRWVRWAAVEGLVRRKKKATLKPLLAALRDRSDMVRFSALQGLVKIADRKVLVPASKRDAVGSLHARGRGRTNIKGNG